jgi:hypothetical protein
MLRILPVVLLIALVVYALIDCVRTPDDDMPVGIPKVLWVILIILFPGIAALAWIVVSRVARANASPAPSGRPGVWSSPTPPRPVRRRGPVAPDDDPEFLARLEAERRKAERERRKKLDEAGTPRELESGHDGGASAGERPADHEPTTPRSPDEGTSEDGTSPSPGANQG